ncbi:hypothetical protein LINPERPRIM_LOCUS39743 [Linum perenne]
MARVESRDEKRWLPLPNTCRSYACWSTLMGTAFKT